MSSVAILRESKSREKTDPPGEMRSSQILKRNVKSKAQLQRDFDTEYCSRFFTRQDTRPTSDKSRSPSPRAQDDWYCNSVFKRDDRQMEVRRTFYESYSSAQMKWAIGSPVHVKECLRIVKPTIETEQTKKLRWDSRHGRDFPGHVADSARPEVPNYEKVNRRPIRRQQLEPIPEKARFVGSRIPYPIPDSWLLQDVLTDRHKQISAEKDNAIDAEAGSLTNVSLQTLPKLQSYGRLPSPQTRRRVTNRSSTKKRRKDGSAKRSIGKQSAAATESAPDATISDALACGPESVGT